MLYNRFQRKSASQLESEEQAAAREDAQFAEAMEFLKQAAAATMDTDALGREKTDKEDEE